MSAAEEVAPVLAARDDNRILTDQWRTLTRAATVVALLTSPAVFLWFHQQDGWSVWMSLAATAGVVIGFRGLIEVVFRRFLPWPSLFGTEDARLKEEDVLGRRRGWFWRRVVRFVMWILLGITIVYVIQLFTRPDATWTGAAASIGDAISSIFTNPTYLTLFIQLPLFFLFNFLIFMGPMLLMGISQIHGFEPGDADWGVRLGDVRGQAEAKEEVRRIVNLWESGEVVRAGRRQARARDALPRRAGHGQDNAGQGHRHQLQLALRHDSGLRLCPDLHRHRRDHRPLPRAQGEKAGGEVGRPVHRLHRRDRRRGPRRAALGGAPSWSAPTSFHDYCFYGPGERINPSGDLILETRAWRDRLFAQRAPERRPGLLRPRSRRSSTRRSPEG